MISTQASRAYLLTRARAMVDGVVVVVKCPAAARAGTAEEAKQRRVEAAPLWLRGRVEGEMALPEVVVEGQEEGAAQSSSYEDERLRAVVGFVLEDLKAELLVELLQAMSPR